MPRRPRPRVLARRFVGTAGILLLALGAGAALPRPASAQSRPEQVILPVAEYTAPDLRALAATHLGDLRALLTDVRRCVPELMVQRHGIAFRRPRGSAAGPPHLTLWVWLDPEQPLVGQDLAARAAVALERYAPQLFPLLQARPGIVADARVGGYAIILTWLGPPKAGDKVAGESLVLFADRATVSEFVNAAIGPPELVRRAQLQLFDGQTAQDAARLTVEDRGLAPPPGPC